jgi:ribosomal-protein-alanine N-acetyltransferase
MTDADIAAAAAIDAPTRMGEDEFRGELKKPWARLWVAREAGEGVVAFLVGWHVADEVHVLNLTTRADRRRKGMARALMLELIAYARRHRVARALLEVRRSNCGAIALYRALGFFATGVRARYYADDEDALEMTLAFDPMTGAVVPPAGDAPLEAPNGRK